MSNIESKGKKLPGTRNSVDFSCSHAQNAIAAMSGESLISKGRGNLAEAGAKGD